MLSNRLRIDQEEKKKVRDLIKRTSPDLNTLQSVRISSRTMIYIKKGDDPEEAKKRFMEKHYPWSY